MSRKKQFTVNLTGPERRLLHALAIQEHRTQGAMLRELYHAAIAGRGLSHLLTRPGDDLDAETLLSNELSDLHQHDQ
jgi:hypothetical protein